MEFFYREMRQRHSVLMESGKPVGGEWNYDSENRKSFGKDGPHTIPFHTGFHLMPSPVRSSLW
jgi:deoxyribodipyrimidine photolyase-related protein